MGASSRAVRESSITVQRVVGVVGIGAAARSAKRGLSASLRTIAASFLVRRRWTLSHSMCRWGELPLMYGRGFLQKGHRSSSSWNSDRCGGIPMLHAWCAVYFVLQRVARVWQSAVLVRRARVLPVSGKVWRCLYVLCMNLTCQPATLRLPRPARICRW